jgi:hypothetical protein
MVNDGGGGHWEELRLLKQSFENAHVTYVSTLAGLARREGIAEFIVIPDCNRNELFRSIQCVASLIIAIFRVRPDVIITTGALPGYLALRVGKAFGKKTIWVDSVANAEEISMAGQNARLHADLWLTQWPDVAERYGVEYAGSVL